jgi:hypothetical protein
MSARTLNAAADILEGDAIALRESHTCMGLWPEDEAEAQALYEHYLSLAADLRHMAEEADEADCLLWDET